MHITTQAGANQAGMLGMPGFQPHTDSIMEAEVGEIQDGFFLVWHMSATSTPN